jgi:hypothetical protein
MVRFHQVPIETIGTYLYDFIPGLVEVTKHQKRRCYVSLLGLL